LHHQFLSLLAVIDLPMPSVPACVQHYATCKGMLAVQEWKAKMRPDRRFGMFSMYPAKPAMLSRHQ
jgi:hypothetical protein